MSRLSSICPRALRGSPPIRGEERTFRGFAYTPDQSRWASGVVTRYRVSVDGRTAAEGEFSNIVNNPVEQVVEFEPLRGRTVRFEALSLAAGDRPGIFGSDGRVDMRVSDGRRYLRGCRSFVWERRARGVCGGSRSRALIRTVRPAVRPAVSFDLQIIDYL